MAADHRPVQLLRAGVQLVTLIPPRALDRANAEPVKVDVPIDLTQLKPAQIEALVEMEVPDGPLRVFCE